MPSVPIDTRLQEELRSLDAVRQAVHAGQAARAERLLSDYRARFPAGYLAPEARQLARELGRLAK